MAHAAAAVARNAHNKAVIRYLVLSLTNLLSKETEAFVSFFDTGCHRSLHMAKESLAVFELVNAHLLMTLVATVCPTGPNITAEAWQAEL